MDKKAAMHKMSLTERNLVYAIESAKEIWRLVSPDELIPSTPIAILAIGMLIVDAIEGTGT